MRYALQRLGPSAIFAVGGTGSAGTSAWPRDRAYVRVVLALDVMMLVAWRVPETLRHRGSGGAGVTPFDRVRLVPEVW